MIPFALAGRRGLGSVQMRGVDVAERLGVPFFDIREPWPAVETLLLVKHWPNDILRRKESIGRLILDPLDAFWQEPGVPALSYWRRVLAETACDEWLATSPACAGVMRLAGARPILAPHHADPRISSGWHDPRGPVVYCGLPLFLADQHLAICRACRTLGTTFVADHRHPFHALRGASLVFAPRFGVTATQLNRFCKPTVKVANAAQAGIPVLASNDPAITTLAPVATLNTPDWAAAIAAATQSPPLRERWTIEDHCELVRGLMGARSEPLALSP